MTAREQIRVGTDHQVLSLIEEVYQKHDSKIYSDIIKNEFEKSFLVIEYSVFNAGVAILSWYFTDDIVSDLKEPYEIFCVEELCK